MDTEQITLRALENSKVLAQAGLEQKNKVLSRMADLLIERKADILKANETDVKEAQESGLRKSMIERLKFGASKIDSRAGSLKKIEALPDPVGRGEFETMANGMKAARISVPLGVILMVYEARPHATVNAGAFCMKAGNAAILRGGKEAKHSNALIGELWSRALEDAGLPGDTIQIISGTHEDVNELLQRSDRINLVIPRGGKGLIEAVAKNSTIPVIKHYEGLCHVYIDGAADLDSAIAIAVDSKCLMPAVCNASETLLIHQAFLERPDDLKKIIQAHRDAGVEIRGCERLQQIVPDVTPATEEDWKTEYLDMIYSVRMVDDVGAAIDHIETYASHHTDAIVTEDAETARRFLQQVDSSVVLHNASTMFCDGESLGMGAEIGISTDKIHARGPMGLNELTSYKFVIKGNGHVMG